MFRFSFFVLCIIMLCNTHAQTLAESLGYDKDARVVIINADDYGMCHSENLGTHRVLEDGVVSSATMMIPCPWINESFQYIKSKNLKNVGVHVALTSEWKRYRWRPVSGIASTLVDEEGFMWRKSIQVENNASLEDVEKEVRAQLDYALKYGIDLSHFDSHMGSLYGTETNRLELLALAMSLSYEYGLPFRIPYFDMTRPFREMGFAILDHLERSPGVPKNFPERRGYYLRLFKNLPSGVTEIYIHPAISSVELKNVTNSYKTRQADVDIFTDPELKKIIKEEKIEVIDFQKLKKWQRKQTEWKTGLKAEDVFFEYLEILEKEAQKSLLWKAATKGKKSWRYTKANLKD